MTDSGPAAASQTNQSTSCTLNLEDFKDVLSNSAYLDANWKCRKCHQLPADHPRAQQGAVQSADIYSLDKALISRISSSVLYLTSDEDVSSTALVWDYVDENVLILTNYHTWAIPEFKNIFPPKKNNKRRADDEDEMNEITFRLQNDFVDQSFSLTPEMFLCCDEQHDYAVLTLPKLGFTTKRIPISLEVGKTLKIHTIGYVGHTNTLNITGGEVCSIIPHGFTMNLLSAPGYSGASIISDGSGRAVGYMGGNLDANDKKNSQHQSYGYKFDALAVATNRDPNSPTTSPTGKSSI